MPALSDHLRDPDNHGRRAFHPGCPICRSERLSGKLTSAPLVSQRARAALATGVLAAATVSPGLALAVEPDTARDGTADATQSAGADVAQPPDFSPDGRASGGQGAFDSAPQDDPESVNIDPDGGLGAPSPRSQPAPPPAQALPLPAAPDSGAALDVPTAPAASEPEPTSAPTPALNNTVASAATSTRPVLTMRARAPKRTTKGQAHVTATPQPVAVSEGPRPAPTLPTSSADHATPSDRAHTIHAGESLWSIASDHLGSGAGPAQIAREVHRLWQLNADRIGTGDPDLLMIGTRLALR